PICYCLGTQNQALSGSVAAGLIVSKAGTVGPTEKAIVLQLSRHPKALGISSGMMAVMSLMPGIPFVPFAALALVTGGAAYYLPLVREKDKVKKAAEEKVTQAKAPVAEATVGSMLAMDLVRVELGYGLLPLVSTGEGNRLTEQVKGLRKQMAAELGFVLPSVRIQDHLQLPPNSYR